MSFPAPSALKLLDRSMQRGRLGHAYLISGPKGPMLEKFATDFLNLASSASHPDLDGWQSHGALVIRPESKSRRIKVETIREQVEPFLFVTTTGAAHRFCVFVDAERMNESTQNAFLRTLEEPPPNTLFLLLSSQPESFLSTILSRVIRVPLMPEPGKRELSEPESHLVELLTQLAQRKDTGSLAGALTLRREFEDILDSVHTRIEKQLETEFAEEKKSLKQTTDVSSQWLDEKEKEMLATVEARYLQARENLMELLLSWMGDVLRHQAGVDRFDLPEQAAATRVLAERWDATTVSRRLTELRKLHTNLHTNVQEGLALEAAFISAFA